jgi:hypothetical protein
LAQEAQLNNRFHVWLHQTLWWIQAHLDKESKLSLSRLTLWLYQTLLIQAHLDSESKLSTFTADTFLLEHGRNVPCPCSESTSDSGCDTYLAAGDAVGPRPGVSQGRRQTRHQFGLEPL